MPGIALENSFLNNKKFRIFFLSYNTAAHECPQKMSAHLFRRSPAIGNIYIYIYIYTNVFLYISRYLLFNPRQNHNNSINVKIHQQFNGSNSYNNLMNKAFKYLLKNRKDLYFISKYDVY